MKDWTMRFMERWQRSKRKKENIQNPVERSVDVNEPEIIGRPDFLRALDILRMAHPGAYRRVVGHLRYQLQLAYRSHLYNAGSSRDFIANAAISRDVKCRTLELLIYDMEHTEDQLTMTRGETWADPVPAGIQAGS